VAVWDTACHRLRGFFTWPLSPIACWISKSITNYNDNFGEAVLRYLRGLSNVESESECSVVIDHNTECVVAERKNQEVYLSQVIAKTQFLIIIGIFY
jgi:hypothetical protein